MDKTNPVLIVIFWLYVMIPLAWGVYELFQNAMPLFTGGQ